MQVIIGKEGLTKTWQDDFPETTECCRCVSEARIGFVAYEGLDGKLPLPRKPDEKFCRDHNDQILVSSLHPNQPQGEGFWPHSCCAVAVYFCKKCMNTTALYNQGLKR